MTPQDAAASLVTWLIQNWASLSIIFILLSGLYRITKLVERIERNASDLGKLMRFHSLVHPNHSSILFNPELTAKDIDPDSVIPCDAKPVKR